MASATRSKSLTRNRVSSLEVTPQQAGQRIDNFLMKHFKGVPRSHVYRILRSGQVRVNSGRIKPEYKIRAGDKLRIPPLRYDDRDDDTVPDSVLDLLDKAVIFEDEHLICIDKPAGIAVHKGSGLRFGVIEAFRQLRPGETLELVHRLDRDTSGCLLLARDRKTLNRCHELLRNEKITSIRKTYLALLHGHWDSAIHTIDIGISKIQRGGEHMMKADVGGDRAVSHYRPVEYFEGDYPATLAEIVIDTGRTHQIRVHSSHAGHPIIGDPRYGDKEANRAHRKLGLKRLLLHARSLYLPLDNPISVEAPIPNDFQQHIDRLRTST